MNDSLDDIIRENCQKSEALAVDSSAPVSAPQTPAEWRKTVAAVVANHPKIRGIHPACDAVPMCSELHVGLYVVERVAGKYIQPVLTDPQGLLVDGRSRLLAASQFSLKVESEEAEESPWVIAWKNLRSRDHRKSHVIVFAAEMVSSFPKDESGSIALWEVLGQIDGDRLKKLHYCAEKGEIRGKRNTIVGSILRVSATSIKKALRLNHEQRLAVTDGASIGSFRPDKDRW